MTLEDMGWSAHFAQFIDAAPDGCIPGRVAAVSRGISVVWTEVGEHRVHHGDLPVATGDWVLLEGERARSVLPRRNGFARKRPGTAAGEQVLAANLDALFVVCGLDGDFNVRRIERYALAAAAGGVSTVIVLNKTDLCCDVQAAIGGARSAAPGAAVVPLSALNGDGLDGVRTFLARGETVAFVGSSGAGKSTLINRLLGFERQSTQATRASDSRGRHTTVLREMIAAPDGWLLIDTPGLRELEPWDAAEALGGAFPDIDALAADCRFRDCRHQTEPSCAVRGAVDDGALDPARLEAYRKLAAEAAYQQRQTDVHLMLEHKRFWKSLHRQLRNVVNEKTRGE